MNEHDISNYMRSGKDPRYEYVQIPITTRIIQKANVILYNGTLYIGFVGDYKDIFEQYDDLISSIKAKMQVENKIKTIAFLCEYSRDGAIKRLKLIDTINKKYSSILEGEKLDEFAVSFPAFYALTDNLEECVGIS